MIAAAPPPDRRQAIKHRHRQAIVDAAAALTEERGSARFTVDELAGRADVSRRTVFNHFTSLDDVVVMAAAELLGHIVDDLATQFGDNTGERSLLEQMAAVTRAEQTVPTMARLVRLLGGEGCELAHHEIDLAQRAFSLLYERITEAVLCADSGLDTFQSQLLTVTFTAGSFHLFRRWSTETGAVDTPESRQLWDELLAQLVDLLRDGETNSHVPAIRISTTSNRPLHTESETS